MGWAAQVAGGGAVPDDGRRGEHPGCSWSACPACCAWANREPGGRKEEGGEGKKKRRKGKKKERRKEKEKREEKKKGEGAPAGFAATIASRAWHRREAERTPNEENRNIRR